MGKKKPKPLNSSELPPAQTAFNDVDRYVAPTLVTGHRHEIGVFGTFVTETRKPAHNLHGPVVEIYGRDLELTTQFAKILNGLMDHPEGWGIDELRSAIPGLSVETDNGIQTRLTKMRKMLAVATKNLPFQIKLHTKNRIVQVQILRKK